MKPNWRALHAWGSGDETVANRKEAAERHAKASLEAQMDIQELTEHYNNGISHGKWHGLMDASPRDLPVFATPSLPVLPDMCSGRTMTTYESSNYLPESSMVARNACDYQSVQGGETVEMLGHSMKALALDKGATVKYTFSTEKSGKAVLYMALIPTQANDKGDIRFSVSIDGNEPTVFSLKEKFRSETWKKNVLRGQAVKTLSINIGKGMHKLTVTALDAHIILDQWMLDFDLNRRFYVFPTANALN